MPWIALLSTQRESLVPRGGRSGGDAGHGTIIVTRKGDTYGDYPYSDPSRDR